MDSYTNYYSIYGLTFGVNFYCNLLNSFKVKKRNTDFTVNVIFDSYRLENYVYSRRCKHDVYGKIPEYYHYNNKCVLVYDTNLVIEILYYDPYQVNIFIDKTVSKDLLEDLLISDLLPLMAQKLNFIAIHAGCATIENKTVAFLGDSGTGKSTFVSGLISKGFKFMSDDTVIGNINIESKNVFVKPSIPYIRLWDSAAEAVFPNKKYSNVFGKVGKRSYTINLNETDSSIKLNTVFILSNSLTTNDIIIEPITKVEGYINLLKSTLMGFALSRNEWIEIQIKYRKVLEFVQIYKLEYPYGFEKLDNTISKFKDQLLT